MRHTLKKRKRYPKKAFTRVMAGDSPKREVYTRDGEVSELGASLSDTSLGKQRKESRGVFGDGLSTRISLLETAIHDLILIGDSVGLRKALKEYALAWIALEKGDLCK